MIMLFESDFDFPENIGIQDLSQLEQLERRMVAYAGALPDGTWRLNDVLPGEYLLVCGRTLQPMSSGNRQFVTRTTRVTIRPDGENYFEVVTP